MTDAAAAQIKDGVLESLSTGDTTHAFAETSRGLYELSGSAITDMHTKWNQVARTALSAKSSRSLIETRYDELGK